MGNGPERRFGSEWRNHGQNYSIFSLEAFNLNVLSPPFNPFIYTYPPVPSFNPIALTHW